MNTKVLSVMYLLAVVCSFGLPRGIQAAETVEVPIDLVIAPERTFDDNDEVVLVIRGVLPSACYQSGATKVRKTDEPGVWVIHQYASKAKDGPCTGSHSIQQLVEFATELKLGIMPAGKYVFTYERPQGDRVVREIFVREAPSDPRENLIYAATDHAEVPLMISSRDEVVIRVSGELRSNCTELEQNISYERVGDVIVVRPMLVVRPEVFCAQVMRPFDREINLGSYPPGQYLVHVRAMGGKSINRLLDVRR